MKHVGRISIARAVAGKSNVFDDIGDWFHDLTGGHKVKW